MLDFKVTTEENAIEKHFCEPLSKKTPVKLDSEMSVFFTKLSLSKDDSNVDSDKARSMFWQYSAFENRISLLGYTTDNRIKIFLLTLTNGNIGQLVMYAYYILYLCKKNNINHVSWETFSNIFFQSGFFLEKDLHDSWDNQKISKKDNVSIGSDNLLDYGIAIKSILLK